MKIIKENNLEINEIITALKNGAVLVLPTDTVYGLVCDAKNEKAVEKIFEIKQRDKSQTLPVFVENIKMAKNFAKIDKNQEEAIKKSWPGAVTFVLKIKNPKSKFQITKSKFLTKNGTIALRAPNYGLIKKIFKKFRAPLAQTSANISGQPATTEIKKVLEQFSAQNIQPDIIIDAGDLPLAKPSKIIDLTMGGEKVLRY